MTFLQFRKIARWSGLRAVLLGAMGLVTLLFPEFLQGSIIYAVAAYAILNGALGILDFLSGRGQGGKAYCILKSFHNGCGNPVWDFKHCLFPLPD